MDERDGADVQAAGRLVGQDQAGLRLQGPAEQELLDVAAGEQADPLRPGPRSARRRPDQLRGHGPRPARAAPGPSAAARGAVALQRPGSGRSTGPPPPPSPRRSSGIRPTPARTPHADPARPGLRRGVEPRRLSADASRPERPASARWPLPETPAMPTISLRVDVSEIGAGSTAGTPPTSTWRSSSTGAPGAAASRRGRLIGAADHRLGDRRRAGARTAPRPPCAPARSTATRRHSAHHLVELVADEHDGEPPAASRSRSRTGPRASCGVSTAVGSSRIRTRASR